MEDCTFCKIVSGKIPSFKIYDDGRYMAILDKYPNIKGQALVITKEHVDSYIFDMDDSALSDFMITVKKVAKLLEKGLGVERVHLVFEGTEINHLHAKLYPAIGISKHEKAIANNTINFDKYEGYLSTLRGVEASDDELEEEMKSIIENNKQ
ncbi:HIT family hydrolase [Candidatus Mancarchaeum acidiphilum]|uniref:HIT family hydrolase n=1 Tax=Candidatus Mancarchaeum acidiphilum TaxID=1920749 RepID=A0A218NME8_9ARCH|nr:HIT domain-containing protein [Candidatus Mancarchaeum acidiphilum]ASI13633.1 HIT family hydrolase [Candidatus Mancarchaeum acidiphilum]